MKTIGKKSWLTLWVVLTVTFYSNSAFSEVQENEANDSLVGRIAHIEGQLLRYVPDEDDWVLTDQDTPFGVYDNLFSSEDGKVEIIMPNNTMVRIGGDTQVQLIELTSENTEIDVSSGTVRLYNKSSSTEIKATTPFGDVIMPSETVCDIYVHETQSEVVSLKGTVAFIQSGSNTRHEVIAGSSAIIANAEQIVASNERVVPEWNSWNVARDVQWRQRMQARGDSQKYLPESLQDQAWDLDTNGRWERVYYDGAYNYFWRPAYVSAGWTPFSTGRWIVWHGEQTWLPCEPFGYVTHHYGNWVYVGNYWYWAPPAYVGMYWYPGRVAWVSSSISIGWFPLAPYEMYYCNNYWGPWSRVRYYNHYYDCRKYRHYRHARYIDHHRYHGSKNYRHAGLRKGHKDEKFRGSARFPENMRRDYKAKNKHLYASNIPKFRDKVKNIDLRGDKRIRQAAETRLSTNPFKRTIAKGFENNRRTGKPIVENTSKNFAKNTLQKQQRLPSVNKGLPKALQENKGKINGTVQSSTQNRKEPATRAQRSFEQTSIKMAENRTVQPAQPRPSGAQASGKINGTVQSSTQNRKELAIRAKRAFEQPSIKMAGNRTVQPAQPRPSGAQTSGKITANRKTFQTTVQGSRQKTGPKVAGQGRPNSNVYAGNTGPVMRPQTNSSGKAPRAGFSNTNSGVGTSYSRPAGQQRVQQGSTGRMSQYSSGKVQQGSTGRMQGYSGRGR